MNLQQQIQEHLLGKRADGTQKGLGYFGKLSVGGDSLSTSTEYSIGINMDGEYMEIPTLVPTLTGEELNLLLNDIIPNKKPIPDFIRQKAVMHAQRRIKQGLSPFARQGEQKPLE